MFFRLLCYKCYCWETNVVSVSLVHELTLGCVSGALVALVHFRCEIKCCAKLHVGKKN